MRAILLLMVLPFGRANRLTFLGGLGALFLIWPFVTSLLTYLVMADGLKRGQLVPDALMWPKLALFAWMLFCLFANRLHDIGRSAMWAVAPIFLPTLVMGVLAGSSRDWMGWGVILTMFWAPVIYAAVALLLLCFRGTEAPNRFGMRPLIA